MQAGKWRSTVQFTEVEIPGLPPQMAQMMRSQMGQPYSTEYCVSSEDLRRPKAEALGGRGAEDCSYEDWSYANGRMRMALVCEVEGQGRMRTVIEGSGAPTEYQGTVNSMMTGGQMSTMRMSGKVSGQRIGDC